MKWALIVGNIVMAIGMLVLGDMAVAAHRTHAYSTYVGLQKQGVLRERPDVDVAEQLSNVAGGGLYSWWIAECGAVACLINVGAIAICWSTPTSEPDRSV